VLKKRKTLDELKATRAAAKDLKTKNKKVL
jgi:hypothetical protein